MSRTYRKSGEFYWNLKEIQAELKDCVERGLQNTWNLFIYKHHTYKKNSDSHTSTSLPKHFRKQVNKSRRAKDKQEIFKEVNIFNYEEQCSKWNCKDNDSWGYW